MKRLPLPVAALLLGLLLAACGPAAPSAPTSAPTTAATSAPTSAPTTAAPSAPTSAPTTAAPSAPTTAAPVGPEVGSPEWYAAISSEGQACLRDSGLAGPDVRGVAPAIGGLYLLHATGSGVGLDISYWLPSDPGRLLPVYVPDPLGEGTILATADEGRLVLLGLDGALGLYRDLEGSLVPLARLPLGGRLADIAVDGGRAYLTVDGSDREQPSQLLAVDISDPAAPALLSSMELSSSAAGALAAAGDLLVLAGALGVSVIDVSDPAAPVVLGSYPLEQAGAVALSGGLAYAAAPDGLRLLDLADPAAPRLTGSAGGPNLFVTDLVVGSGVAYTLYSDVGSSELGTVVLTDVSNPAEPRPLGQATARGVALRAAPLGDGVAVGFGRRGLLLASAEACPS